MQGDIFFDFGFNEQISVCTRISKTLWPTWHDAGNAEVFHVEQSNNSSNGLLLFVRLGAADQHESALRFGDPGSRLPDPTWSGRNLPGVFPTKPKNYVAATC